MTDEPEVTQEMIETGKEAAYDCPLSTPLPDELDFAAIYRAMHKARPCVTRNTKSLADDEAYFRGAQWRVPNAKPR
jgi:hypothetical protein